MSDEKWFVWVCGPCGYANPGVLSKKEILKAEKMDTPLVFFAVCEHCSFAGPMDIPKLEEKL
jgi:hypothetical protein